MRRIMAIALPVVVLVGVGLWLHSRSPGKASAEPYEVATVTRGNVGVSVTADGTLQPRTTVAVKSFAGGRVDVLAVEVGDVVKAGDLIAKIDPTDSLSSYDQAIADLSAAEAKLRQAQAQAAVQPRLTAASIAQAEASYHAAVKDLSGLQEATHPQQRARAKADLDKAQANLALAEADLKRVQGLKANGFVSQSDVDSAVNRRDLAQSDLASTQQQWDTLDRQQEAELEATRARVAQAKASLDSARAGAVQDELKRADVVSAQAQVARTQAAVTNAKTSLDYTTINAPRGGVILQKSIEEGTIVTSGKSSVTQGTDIVLLGDLSEMLVEVSLDEADVGMVRQGQEAKITVDAFPDATFRGRIARIDPQATTAQNVTTVLVTVRVENPDARLKPGMTATCEFMVSKAANVLMLPNQAVQGRRGQNEVLIRQGDKVVPVPVKIGLVGDDFTEIKEGVREGEEVLMPSLAAPVDEGSQRAAERGRRMGGAGGFLREPTGGPG